MADVAGITATGRAGRSWCAALFLVVNIAGLGAILWRLEANRAPASTMVLVGHQPRHVVEADEVGKVVLEMGVPLDATTVRPDTIRIMPPVPGTTALKGARELVFEPAEKLRNATRYEVRVDPALRGSGGELPPEEPVSFSTQPLAVLSVSQASLEPDGSCILEFEFSGPVDPDELIKHLKLTYPDGSSATFGRVGGRPSARLCIRCPRPTHDRLHVEVARGLAGTEGPLGTLEARRFEVEVSGKLRLLSMSAGFRRGRGRITVRMNSAVDVGAARQFVAIDPPVEFSLERDYRGLHILGDFRCGERYRVTLKRGLSAGIVQPLEADVTRTVWFPDKPKSFRFSAPGGYLTPTGVLKVPVASTNVASLQLTLDRLYASNLVEHVLGRNEGSIGSLGPDVARREIKVRGERNEETETLVDLREVAGADARGVWRLSLRSREAGHWRRDSTTVVVTDLGASVRLWQRRVMVWVTALADARPAEGAEVTVYSDRRQVLGSGVTGPDGVAVVDLAEPPGAEAPAMVVLERGEELSYVSLSGTEVTHGAGCYGGRPFLSAGYEVFGFAERGIYRPGDAVCLSGFVRGPGRATPPAIPLDLVVLKPDGRELLREVVESDGAGRLAARVAVPVEAPSGAYRAAWRLPGSQRPLGATDFLVADYMPRTLRVTVDCPEGRLPAGRPVQVGVAAEHLFGDPAGGLAVRCRSQFAAEDFAHEGWQGYRFGDLRSESSHCDVHEQKQSLDVAGRAAFKVPVPKVEAPSALTTLLEVEVREPGGRALTEYLTRSVDPWPCYVGVKPPADAPVCGEPATFDLAAVAPDGTGDDRPFSAALCRVTWSNVLRRTGSGRLEYDWTRREESVTSAEGAFEAGRASVTLTPVEAGPHRLVVESEGACASVYEFHVRGPGAGWAAEDPEKLLLTLDRASYRPGETARLGVRSPFGGTALVCVERDRVLDQRVVEMADGADTLEFTVSEAWRPNVYLTVTVVRPVQAEDEWRPHRASGAVSLWVDSEDRRLDVELESPEEVRPGEDMELAVSVSAAGEAQPGAAVVVAAVDEGVLCLTDSPAPDPWGFFYSERRLGVRTFDMFARLARELSAWTLGRAASPGGGEGADRRPGLARRLNPVDARRVRTAVLWEGALVADEEGAARARFRVPEYVGEMRVTAVAGSGARFGSASQPLKVRSPLMARSSWPRFVAPGDEFDVPVTVLNGTGRGGKVEVDLGFTGPLQAAGSLPAEVELQDGAEETVYLRVRATGVGTGGARLTARLGVESCGESVEVPIRPACSFARLAGSVCVEPGQETRIDIPGGFLPGTARCHLVVAGNPTVELAGAVEDLLRYPYGCVEQTTSRLVPLIYLPELAAQTCPDVVDPQEVDEVLRAGFLQLRMMQTRLGGLATWPGGGVPCAWGSIYTADLLVEARKAGHGVPGDLLEPLLEYLQGNLEAWVTAGDNPGRGRAAYAAYVLTRAGRPPSAWLARLEEELADGGVSQTARFRLAAAMVAAGQAEAARGFIGDARPSCEAREGGGCLDSPVREAAVMLLVLLDVDPESAQVPALAERLRRSVKLGRWGTTQENAFALMALGKNARRLGETGDIEGTVTLPDGSMSRFSSKEGLHLPELPAGRPVLISAEGQGTLWAFWSAEGVPRDGKVKEEDSGLIVRRTILDMEGQPVASARLVQGELYRVKLTAESDRPVENLVIVDLLPAGLEIEDPGLRGSARLGGEETRARWRVHHVERRDDRLLVFADLPAGRGGYGYVVRAVTAGEFARPPVEAACMYDPGVYSVHGAGVLEVERPG
jgi:uncharacterized protein YfaS (alpha-2-macroglobulin family)